MLQAVNAGTRVRQSSSLYCVWIRQSSAEGAPLVAVWIDREMRAFTGELGLGAQPPESLESQDHLPEQPAEFEPATDGDE